MLAVAFSAPAVGCELCAIYADDHGLGDPRHGWFTGAAEQFTTFGSMQLGGREVSNPAGERLETSTTQFVLGYSFNERFSLQANIPYIHRSFQRAVGSGVEDGTESGLGDATLVGKLLLLRKDTEKSSFAWSLLGGLKFPTGSTTRLGQEAQLLASTLRSTGSVNGTPGVPGGDTHGGASTSTSASGVTTVSGIHGYDLTLGSGSVDLRIGTSMSYRRGRTYLSGSVQYAIATQGDYGYRFANDLTWDSSLGYYLISEPSRTLALEAAFSGEHKGADTYAYQSVDSTGFTVMYLGPKLSYTWKDRLSAHFGVDFPVSVTNSGLQAVPGTRVRAGFTWLLGPSSGETAGAEAKPRSVGMDGSAPPIWTPAPETRFYGGVEYLMWWAKDAPLSVPLVSTGTISDTHHGFLEFPDSTIVYGAPHYPAKGGNDSQRFQAFTGTRFTFGYSLGSERRFAIEASGFALLQQSAGYGSYSDATGQPVINIPVFNTTSYSPSGRPGGLPPAEDGLPASVYSDPHRVDGNAGVFSGGVNIKNTLELWGTEAVGVISLYRTPSWELSGLVGFRYLDLAETFNLEYQSIGVSGRYVGTGGQATDTFETRNRFFGGILGMRGRYSAGRLSVDLSGRVALGVSSQMENIFGGYYSYGFNSLYSAGSEGVFAQPANSGRTYSSRFAVVPDAQIKIGYAITPRLRATIGYDFLYYSSVLRPGDQINRNIPKGQTFQQGGKTVSTTSPVRLSQTSDFFAHGITFGLDFRF
ncbi:MAG: BBP7 family outer membrane beta-barrel protein [Chthoniobacteraceae bacterium]